VAQPAFFAKIDGRELRLEIKDTCLEGATVVAGIPLSHAENDLIALASGVRV